MKTNFLFAIIALTLFDAARNTSAQNTVVTYQGQVTDAGTNFSGVGQFKFELVTSSNQNATATGNAVLSGTFVTGYVVTFGGSGYLSAPSVTISGGGGSGATATANLTGGVVTSITAGQAGTGYTSVPTVTIAAPPVVIGYVDYWSNDGTGSNGSEPVAAVDLAVSNGLFTVALGNTNVANMRAFPATLFHQTNLQLRIWFNDGVNGSVALSPLQNLTAAPYASFAAGAATLTSPLSATLLPAGVATLSANQTFLGQNSFENDATIFYGSTTTSGLATFNANATFNLNATFNAVATFAGVGVHNGQEVFNTSAVFNGPLIATNLNVSNIRIIPDPNGGLEIGPDLSFTATPFIDFHYGNGVSNDYNVRLINDANGILHLLGTLVTSGNVTANGILLVSDRNAKENFTPLDRETMLDKVAALPLTEWNYKQDASAVRHVGPMAQDFQAAFALNGGDAQHISVVDEAGVALAAIQGLNQKLTGQMKEKDAEIQALKQSVEELKKMVQTLAEKK